MGLLVCTVVQDSFDNETKAGTIFPGFAATLCEPAATFTCFSQSTAEDAGGITLNVLATHGCDLPAEDGITSRCVPADDVEGTTVRGAPVSEVLVTVPSFCA